MKKKRPYFPFYWFFKEGSIPTQLGSIIPYKPWTTRGLFFSLLTWVQSKSKRASKPPQGFHLCSNSPTWSFASRDCTLPVGSHGIFRHTLTVPRYAKRPQVHRKCHSKKIREMFCSKNQENHRISLGVAPLPVTVTTRIITFLVGDPYKPSFPTVTGRGPYPRKSIQTSGIESSPSNKTAASFLGRTNCFHHKSQGRSTPCIGDGHLTFNRNPYFMGI